MGYGKNWLSKAQANKNFVGGWLVKYPKRVVIGGVTHELHATAFQYAVIILVTQQLIFVTPGVIIAAKAK